MMNPTKFSVGVVQIIRTFKSCHLLVNTNTTLSTLFGGEILYFIS